MKILSSVTRSAKKMKPAEGGGQGTHSLYCMVLMLNPSVGEVVLMCWELRSVWGAGS